MSSTRLFNILPNFHRTFSITPLSFKNAKPTIGFIGLGQMGGPMSTNLIQNAKGQYDQFMVYDVSSSATEAFRQRHPQGIVAKSLKEIADHANIIFTMLPTPQHVEQVYLEGLQPHIKSNTLLVDSSTIDPGTSQKVAQVIQQNSQALVLDAPVSGGTLSFSFSFCTLI
ncbi:hypothetical protein HMI54_015753 [Coelomomyces lativittatus]|nr:hypothetical protein HMI56_007170 [Coelomomyces lativittatus]KAJ1512385.1 hypothetical protein HMI54_015753 [Coelomomyces lativittatus]